MVHGARRTGAASGVPCGGVLHAHGTRTTQSGRGTHIRPGHQLSPTRPSASSPVRARNVPRARQRAVDGCCTELSPCTPPGHAHRDSSTFMCSWLHISLPLPSLSPSLLSPSLSPSLPLSLFPSLPLSLSHADARFTGRGALRQPWRVSLCLPAPAHSWPAGQ